MTDAKQSMPGAGLRGLIAALMMSSMLVPALSVPASAEAGDIAGIEALIAEHKFDKALEELNLRQREGKGDVDTYLLLARVYLETGAGIASEAAIGRARRLGADYAQTAVPFAKALLVQSKFGEALAALRGVTIPPAFQQEALVVMGDAYFAERQYEDAERSYRQVLELYGESYQAYLGLSRLALQKADLDAAMALADKAIAVKPDNTMVQYTRGLIARYQGKPAEAEGYFLEALRLYPGNILVNLELAAIRINQRRLEEAEAYLDAVYAVSSKHPMALYLSGTILASKGRFEEADAMLLRARDVTERYLPAMYVRGLVSYQLGHYTVAEGLLSTVIRARPANRPARLALAGTLLRQNRAQEAYDLLQPMLRATDEKDGGVIAMAAAAAMATGRAEEGAALYNKLSAVDAQNQEHVLKGLPAKLALATYVEGDQEAAMSALSQITAGEDKDLRDLGILGSMQLQSGDVEGAEVTIATVLKAAPDRALGYNMRGTLEYQRGQYKEAIRDFSEALDRNADYYTALRNRGLALMQIEQYEASAKDLRRLLTLQPSDVRAKAALGRALLRSGQFDEAVEYFRTAVQVLPNAVDVWADYAEALSGAGNTSQAIVQARETTVMAADRPDLLKRMGVLLLKLNQPQLASRALSRFVAFDPDNGEAHLLQGRAQLATGLYTGARLSFTRAMKAEQSTLDPKIGVWYQFAAAAGGRQFRDAKLLLPQLDPASRPDDVRAAIVGTYLLSAGDTAAAVTAFRDALAVDPSGDAAVGLARALDQSGDTEGAIQSLRTFLKAYPAERPARIELGGFYEKLGRDDDAAREYEVTVRTGVADAQMIARLAGVYKRLGNTTSVPLAEKAYLIQPEDPFILDTYGWIMLQAARDTRRAVQALERATRRAPSVALYRYHLGMAYLAEGRRAEARNTLEQALKLDPNFPDAAAARQQLELLR